MKGISLYIHIPFCKQKCLYCDFPSFGGSEALMIGYAEALSKEIKKIPEKKINTIFIGGGTPTYLCLEGWKIIKNSIDKLCKDDSIEFTVEANPGTIDKEKLIFFKELGVNRISMGLQAVQNSLLKRLGRVHTIEQFKESYNLARECGFSNINVDIMFGLPGQSLEDLVETLRDIIALNPEHISCYSLIVEEGTPFYKMYEEGKLVLPDEDLERDMYRTAVNMLEEGGYFQYEISNFSKKGKESRHNLVYWNLGDYIGCGSGAHSYFEGKRFNNEVQIEKYIQRMKNEHSAVVEEYKNSSKDDMEEFMFMGLRKLEGVSERDFSERFKMNINLVYGKVIDKYIKQGLLIRADDRVFLTSRGIEISNTVMAEFIL